MNQEKCPFPGCPLEKTGGCQPEYKVECLHQAEVILEFHKNRIKQEANAPGVNRNDSSNKY